MLQVLGGRGGVSGFDGLLLCFIPALAAWTPRLLSHLSASIMGPQQRLLVDGESVEVAEPSSTRGSALTKPPFVIC